MKILLIHNKYKLSGGEDSMFDAEKNILESYNHSVRTLFFDNKEIDSIKKMVKLSYQLIYNKKSEEIVNHAIEDFRPDIIHVHNLFYMASPSILFAAYKNGIPVVITLHNYRLICSGSLLMRDSQPCELCINKIFPLSGVRYGCHQGSKIKTAQLTLATGIHKLMKTWTNKVSMYIASTEFARYKFINSSLNLLPEKILVKSNSVVDLDISNFEDREDYFLFVGRLSKEKGIEILLKAFEKRNIIIEIVGDGPFRDLTEIISTTNPNIKYWGYIDRPAMISKLKKCKALIVPSVCYESLPTAILEAFSTGTPVIISDIGNLNEIVSDNYNGMHFKNNDSADLYKVVEKFDKNNLQYKELYLNARKTYLEKYTPEMNYRNLIDIYNTAISTISIKKWVKK
jgi:glycosyltransferase involved in cell wall biosynthesis